MAEAAAARFAHPAFPYPVGVLAFNRPAYLDTFTESLTRQTLALDPARVVVHLDAYPDSLDSQVGRPDSTAAVADLVASRLAGAQVIRQESNAGIALAYDALERALFALPDSEWVVLFEDDLRLAPRYLEALAHAISTAGRHDDIVCISASGDVFGEKSRGDDTYYPMHYAWGYALRRSHWQARLEYTDAYLDVVRGSHYSQRDMLEVYSALAVHGILPVATAQDAVKEAIRRHLGRLAVTTGVNFAEYLGEEGESFSPRMFEVQGHRDRPVAGADRGWSVPFDPSLLSQVRFEEQVSFASRVTANLVGQYAAEVRRGERRDQRLEKVLADLAASNEARARLRERVRRLSAPPE